MISGDKQEEHGKTRDQDLSDAGQVSTMFYAVSKLRSLNILLFERIADVPHSETGN